MGDAFVHRLQAQRLDPRRASRSPRTRRTGASASRAVATRRAAFRAQYRSRGRPGRPGALHERRVRRPGLRPAAGDRRPQRSSPAAAGVTDHGRRGERLGDGRVLEPARADQGARTARSSTPSTCRSASHRWSSMSRDDRRSRREGGGSCGQRSRTSELRPEPSLAGGGQPAGPRHARGGLERGSARSPPRRTGRQLARRDRPLGDARRRLRASSRSLDTADGAPTGDLTIAQGTMYVGGERMVLDADLDYAEPAGLGRQRRATRCGSSPAVPARRTATRPCTCCCASRRWARSRTRRCSTSRSAGPTRRSGCGSSSASSAAATDGTDCAPARWPTSSAYWAGLGLDVRPGDDAPRLRVAAAGVVPAGPGRRARASRWRRAATSAPRTS